ncbi:Uncharacterized protein TCM_042888 [Theobroma cacao]|uniref:Uncharacterized protein n=1 Tax=Theobroma cacao TaxID=3641 RepID=A0A061FN23_THECC|nr:Uncharacterized protein TCM_042888 [Theobroma cacao]
MFYVLCYHEQLGTNVMNIVSHSHTMKFMIIQNIIFVTFVKKEETPTFGFIIVHFVTSQLIPNVFLEITRLSSSGGGSLQRLIIHTYSFSGKRFIFTLNVLNVVSSASIWLLSVQTQDAALLSIGDVAASKTSLKMIISLS